MNKRIEIGLTPNKELIPFDYQQMLSEAFHGMLGSEQNPDTASLYSFSWLQTVEKGSYAVVPYEGLNFQEGCRFFVSCHSPSMAKHVLQSVADYADKDLLFGMRIETVDTHPTPDFKAKARFYLNSPALVKQTVDGHVRYLTYKSPFESAVYLSNALKSKMDAADIEGDVLVRFDDQYSKAKEKLVTVGLTQQECSICPIIIEASSPEIVKFAWEVGIGHSTGIGFGSVM